VNKLYRQVSVKERLPKNNGGIIAICSPEDCLQQLYFKDGQFLDPMDDLPMNATAWLEEVELPSTEILEALDYNGGFKDGVNWIINKLKGTDPLGKEVEG